MGRAFGCPTIIFTCNVLSGVSPAVAEGPTGEELGPPYAQWTSCMRLIPADPGYTPADLQGMFEPPGGVEDLLKNLKLAWDRNLLVQQSFYDGRVLQKVFGGAQLTWQTSRIPLGRNVGFAAEQLSISGVPGITVTVESRCWKTESKRPNGKSRTEVSMVGFLYFQERPIPGMTLANVREVFGPETDNRMDEGISLHGYAYTPTIAGMVVYRDAQRTRAMGGLGIETTFLFQIRPPQPGKQGVNSIIDDDVVEEIDMKEAQHRVLDP